MRGVEPPPSRKHERRLPEMKEEKVELCGGREETEGELFPPQVEALIMDCSISLGVVLTSF